MVENGQIDFGHHDRWNIIHLWLTFSHDGLTLGLLLTTLYPHTFSAPINALNEYKELDKAIGAAQAVIDPEETTVLVTADHG